MLHVPILHSMKSDLLKEHHLEGFYYSKIENLAEFRKSWLNTWAHNEVLLTFAKKMNENFPELIFLKGISLLDDVYDDLGARFMSDIDILVPIDTLSGVESFLTSEGFSKIKSSMWYGNDFKIEYNKIENEREINIELHSRLFYHVLKNDWNYSYKNLKKLSTEDNLIHIIGHCGFNHNFQKIYWMIDIYLYLYKYEKDIDVDILLKRAKELKLVKVFGAALYILDRYFTLPKKFKLLVTPCAFNFLLSQEFVLNPNQAGLNQYLVKHLFRDSVYESFKYDFFWMINKIENHLIVFLKK